RPTADGGRFGFASAPLDGNGQMEVFYGSGKGLDRSTDSGFSFGPADFGLTMVKILNMAGNGNTIFATTRAGWLKSLDGGANWTWYDYTGGYQMVAMTN